MHPMRIAIILFFLGLTSALAQPVITAGPKLDAITHSTARVVWITNTSSNSRVEYGTTSSYGVVNDWPKTVTVHGSYMSGLAPATTYHFRVCSTAGSQTVCSQDQTFTTAAAPSVHPVLPNPPAEKVDTSMPSGPYGPPFMVNSGCTNMGSILNSLSSLTGSLNYEIRIPPSSSGTECHGIFEFPRRPNHTGWIVVRPDMPDTALPPEGVRTRDEFLPNMARFRSDVFGLPTSGGYNSQTYIPSGCSPDSYYWITSYGSGFPLLVCKNQGSSGSQEVMDATAASPVVLTVPGHGYSTGQVVEVANIGVTVRQVANNGTYSRWIIDRIDENTFALRDSYGSGAFTEGGTVNRLDHLQQVAHTSGTSLPATCTPDEWFYKTNGPEQKENGYWCTSPNKWTNVRMVNTSEGTSAFAAIRFEDNASRYRFLGIEVTHNPVPNPYPSGWEHGNNRQGEVGSLVYTNGTMSHLIFDRVDVHGQGFPARITHGLYLNGSHVALIDSRVHEIHRWCNRPVTGNLEAYAVIVTEGGPGKIENNLLNSNGITLFFPDNSPLQDVAGPSRTSFVVTPPSDFEIVRNDFVHYEKHIYNRPENLTEGHGKTWFNRHHLEWKRGRRMLVKGNTFHINWSDVNKGGFVILTPTSSGTMADTTINSVSGGTVSTNENVSYWKPGFMVYIRNSSSSAHNGLWEIATVSSHSFTLVDPPSGSGTGGVVQVVASDVQVSDIDIVNNTFRYGPSNLLMIGFHNYSTGSLPTKLTARVRFHNNLLYGMNGRSHADGGWVSGNSIDPDGTKARGSYAASAAYGLEDLIITGNTFIDFTGESQHILFHDSTVMSRGKNEGLKIEGNLFLSANDWNTRLVEIGGGPTGLNALNEQWTQWPNPSWSFRDNVFCCGLSSNGYPEGNFWPAAPQDIKLQRYTAMNYTSSNFRLRPDSRYRGGDPGEPVNKAGADIGAIEAAHGKVQDVRVREITAGSATVSYLAPDAQSCTVEFSENAAWGTGTRISDGGGNRVRNMVLNSLAPGKKYHYRILCAVEQPSGTFSTRGGSE
ncbi:MAG: fibronectin type III domain-containing protein [Bryobacteraceae bacterium]